MAKAKPDFQEPIDPQRSKMMASIGQRGTKPEMIVRRICHSLGFRYRLHVKTLPGSPDLVFPRLKKIVFVHGCFWHRHENCSRTTTPKTRTAFWEKKFADNVSRDERQIFELCTLGWQVLIIWECETKEQTALKEKLVGFLGGK